MTDVVDLSEQKRARANASKGGPRDPETGSSLKTILDGVLSKRTAADELCSDIEKAAGILEIFANDCADPHRAVSEAEIDRQWYQVEYLAKQLLRHASELSGALADMELGVFAVRRCQGTSPSPPLGRQRPEAIPFVYR